MEKEETRFLMNVKDFRVVVMNSENKNHKDYVEISSEEMKAVSDPKIRGAAAVRILSMRTAAGQLDGVNKAIEILKNAGENIPGEYKRAVELIRDGIGVLGGAGSADDIKTDYVPSVVSVVNGPVSPGSAGISGEVDSDEGLAETPQEILDNSTGIPDEMSVKELRAQLSLLGIPQPPKGTRKEELCGLVKDFLRQ